MISESANESVVGDAFRDIIVPVVVMKSSLYKEMRLTGQGNVNQC